MANFTAMKTNVKNWSGVQNLTRVGAAINAVYRALINRFFWDQLVVRGSVTLVAGTSIYSLDSLSPTFRWIKRAWYRAQTSTVPIPIWGSKGVFRTGGSQGDIFRFRVRKRTSDFVWVIEFEILPSGSFIGQHPTIEFEYYYQPPDLSAGSDIPRFDAGDHQVIEFGAVVLLTGKQGDVPGFTMFHQMWTDGYADMEDKAINFMGRPIVTPGFEITESIGGEETDYGMPIPPV